MSFTTESKKQNRMPILDGQIIIRGDKTFTSSAYCKLTFSGVQTHFGDFLPSTCKFGITLVLIDACEFAQVDWITQWISLSKGNFLKKWLPWGFY